MNVRLFPGLVLLGACCVGPGAARADTLFDLSATLTQTGAPGAAKATLTGTFTINTATGAFDGFSNVTFTNPGSSAFNGTYLLTNGLIGPTPNAFPEIFVLGGSNSATNTGVQLILILPFIYSSNGFPFAGYSGGPICSTSYACSSNGSGSTVTVSPPGVASITYTVDAGTLTAETPEPSGVILMATGLVGAIGLVGRRSIRI